MNNYLKSKDKLLCCGCRSCENICGNKCISMKADEEGFLYPTIDEGNCVKCGLCIKVCPISENEKAKNVFQKVYCAYTKDGELRKQSSSGGVFSVIAKYVIDNGGIVFGCSYDENLLAHHTYVNNEKDLAKFRGSKYMQSDLNTTFKKAKEYLDNGILVLYSGTPCQIAALKTYLLKSYENLILIDLICHGVPSPKLFKMYLHYLEGRHSGRVTDFKFRNKCEYNSSLGCSYTIKRNSRSITKLQSWYCSPYFYGFEKSLLSRPICYECQFSNSIREGDITIGDFWGAENYFNDIDIEKGVSVCIVNSLNGELVFQKIRKYINYKEATFEMASERNRNLISPTLKPEDRNSIYYNLYNGNFQENCRKYLRPNKYYAYLLASKVPQKAKEFAKFLIKYKK